MSGKLQDRFDSLTEAELERLDSSLDRISAGSHIDCETKDRILSSAMRKADLKMDDTNKKIRIKKSRKKLTRFAIIAAAVIVLTAMVGMAYYSDNITRFFGEEVSPFESEIYSKACEVSNDDITFTVDGVVADEFQYNVAVTLTANSSKGRKYIKKLRKGIKGDFTFLSAFESSQNGEVFPGDPIGCIYWGENTSTHFYAMLSYQMEDLDTSSPLIITETFSGLSVELDTTPTFPSVKLVSDDENTFENVSLSPFGVYIRVERADDSDTYFDIKYGAVDASVTYRDGRTEQLEVGRNDILHPDYFEEQEAFSELTPIDDIVTVEIDGITYKKAE